MTIVRHGCRLSETEEPTDAIVIDASRSPQAVADEIVAELRTRHPATF